MKLSDKVYKINLGVPDEFEDMSQYSAYLGNGVVSLEKRIAELEAENERLQKLFVNVPDISELDLFKEGMERAAEIPVDIKSEIYGQDPSYKEGVRVGVCLKERAIRAEL